MRELSPFLLMIVKSRLPKASLNDRDLEQALASI